VSIVKLAGEEREYPVVGYGLCRWLEAHLEMGVSKGALR